GVGARSPTFTRRRGRSRGSATTSATASRRRAATGEPPLSHPPYFPPVKGWSEVSARLPLFTCRTKSEEGDYLRNGRSASIGFPPVKVHTFAWIRKSM
ncbi:Os11g0532200, partial [Oryza sativa Japonica Group]